jgi:hypothetical protein
MGPRQVVEENAIMIIRRTLLEMFTVLNTAHFALPLFNKISRLRNEISLFQIFKVDRFAK